MQPLSILVEFLGTFLFLSVIITTGNPWLIGGSLAVLAYFAGSISGANFNPAVTIMLLYNRSIAMDNAVAYILAQIAAGLLALAVHTRLKKQGIL